MRFGLLRAVQEAQYIWETRISVSQLNCKMILQPGCKCVRGAKEEHYEKISVFHILSLIDGENKTWAMGLHYHVLLNCCC